MKKTPLERAIDLCRSYEELEAIKAIIQDAVKAEREACAMIADRYMQSKLDAYGDRKVPPLFSAKIRNAIRDRESV
jgi:hypothetical protein